VLYELKEIPQDIRFYQLMPSRSDFHHALFYADVAANADDAPVLVSCRAVVVVVADHTTRIAANRLTQIIIIICCIADGHVIVHLFDVVRDINVVFVFAAGSAVFGYVYVLCQIQFVLHELVAEIKAGSLTSKLIHMRTLDYLFASLAINGFLIFLILPMVHLTHKTAIIRFLFTLFLLF